MRISTALVFLILVLAAMPSLAITTTHLVSDAQMLAILSDSMFVGEGRIGDGLGAATFELDLGRSTADPQVTGQFGWQNGVAVPFVLVFNYSTNEVTFSVGDSVLHWVSPLSGFTDVFLRTRAVLAGSEILLDDLYLDGIPLNDVSQAVGSGLDILWIQGAPILDGFTMTGRILMMWGGTRPSQSQLAFQVKVGKLKPTATEPATWGSIKALFR